MQPRRERDCLQVETERTMYYVCPSCQTELTSSEDDQETVDLTCPECGCVIDVEADETLAYSQEDKPRLKHFELLDAVGRGAYGLVWRARDTQLDRIVAIKMPTREGMDAREAKRFLQEAQSAAQLRHPGIVSVHETGIEEGRPYIVSDFIEGVTLSSFLTARSLTLRESAQLCLAISRAVHYAHECGIIHRDLKPSNILIDERMQPFVTDFGLAKRISADATIAAHVSVLGTPAYMAPEQARGESHYVDQRCDVYSLGVILFLLLTREKPFRGNTQMVLHQVIHDEPPSPRKLNGKVPRDLETICLKCLEKTSKRRYESAGALADDLQRYLDGKPIDARPISLPERTWRWCQRRPAVAGLLLSLFLSLSIGLLGVTHFWLEAARNAAFMRASLYRAQMNLVATYYDGGDLAAVDQTLDRFASRSWSDMRGFEWRYFDALTAPFAQIGSLGDVVVDVAVSSDGALCAACSRDRQVRVWDARTGEQIRTLTQEVGQFNSIAFFPTGSRLATGSSDGFVRLWDPLRGDASVLEIKHGPAVQIVRFSTSGGLLLSAGDTGAVRIWEPDDLSLVAQIPSGMSRTVDVQFVPGTERIAVATADGRIRLWDVRAQRQLQMIETDSSIQTITCSDDGEAIATGTYSGNVQLWSLQVQDESRRLLEYDSIWGRIDDIEYLPGTSFIGVVANDGRLHLFDVEQQREVRKLMTHSLGNGVLARSADGKYLCIGGGNGAVQLVRLHDVSAPAIFWHEADIQDVDFLTGGRLIAVSSDGDLRVWDVTTGKFDAVDAAESIEATVSAQPGGRLIASAGAGPYVTLRDQDSLAIVEQVAVSESGVMLVRFSPTGMHLAVAARQGPVLVYRMNDSPQGLFEIPEPDSKVNALAFATDDSRLAVALEDGHIELFDGASGTRQSVLIEVPETPFALSFCEHNSVLAIGTDSGEIHLWDLASGARRGIIKGHSSRINALAVLPDGTTLVSGGRDRELRLWDTPSGELITTLSGHDRQVFTISVAADGNAIASGGLQGDVRLWQAGH